MKKLTRGIIVVMFLGIVLLIIRDNFDFSASQPLISIEKIQETIPQDDVSGEDIQEDIVTRKNNGVPSFKDDLVTSGEEETWKEYQNNPSRPGDYGAIRVEDKDQYQECDLSQISNPEKGKKYEIPCKKDPLFFEYVADEENIRLVNIYDGDKIIIKHLNMIRSMDDDFLPSSFRYSRDNNIAYWDDVDSGYGGGGTLFYSTKNLAYTLFIDMFGTEVSLVNAAQKVGFNLFSGEVAPKGVACTKADTSDQEYPIVKCIYKHTTFDLPYLTRNQKNISSYEDFIGEKGWQYQKDFTLYTLPSEKTFACYNDDYAGTCNFWIDIFYNTTTSQITRQDPYKKVIIDANDFTKVTQE